MQPQIILQVLLLAVATAAPMPQRTSDLSGLAGSDSPFASGFPLSNGGLGSGSSFDLSRLTNLFSGGGTNTGPGTGFDLSKLRDFFGGGGSTGSLPSSPSVPSVPSVPSTGGSTGGGFLGGGLGVSSTANDITSKKACKPNVLLFARGTTEGGNIGSSVGPSLNRELEKLAPGKFLFQGIDYQADIAGITALGRPGGAIAVRQIGEATALCPDARIFLSGYSQGAMVMHNAVRDIPAGTKAKVGVSNLSSSMVIFYHPSPSPRGRRKDERKLIANDRES